MKTAIVAVTAASLMLSGCLTSRLAKMTPTEQIGLINAMADAGCAGQIHFGIGGQTASGVSFGAASGEFSFTGGCDPAKARTRVIPIKDLSLESLGVTPDTTGANGAAKK